VSHRTVWEVIAQRSTKKDEVVCEHRWSLLADICAIRQANRNRNSSGVFYDTRKAAR